ncbi:MAG TPA: L-lactate permease [Candidatus Dormibacteraeota bacterium]|nr:L-lactate permease [Candidatus Dormibacteraeota bacterium]
MTPWPQPLDPLHSIDLSALAAALPMILLLILMGALRKSGFVAAAWGLLAAGGLAVAVWRMPPGLALRSTAYGLVYGLWPIMWIVFAALWLYNLSVDTGKFDLLRLWMAEHASGDARIQVILVAFCFGALLEGTAGFGAPVAVAAFLLLGLGFSAREAMTVCLVANTAPVAFGGLGIPIVALAAVTGLDLAKLSSMAGRQVPFLSLVLPSYLVWIVARRKGVSETWPAAVVTGASFALTQFLVSNFWGPYAADIVAALAAIVALTLLLRVWKPPATLLPRSGAQRADAAFKQPGQAARENPLTTAEALAAWAPWILLSAVMVAWSYLKLFQVGQLAISVPQLHNSVFVTLYNKPYAAVYLFQPLAAGTAALTATVLTALVFRVPPRTLFVAGLKTARQLRLPCMTVVLIVGLAYLYNYSGMAYTLGAALAALGWLFPLVSGYLGWMACFLSGSDTASNLLFGNLQVAAAHQLGLNPILLAATNSSGAVTGKMISPQNIAVGVTTVGLVGQEGNVLRTTFWHSLVLAAGLSVLAFAQAYWLKWMVP